MRKFTQTKLLNAGLSVLALKFSMSVSVIVESDFITAGSLCLLPAFPADKDMQLLSEGAGREPQLLSEGADREPQLLSKRADVTIMFSVRDVSYNCSTHHENKHPI